VITNFNGFIGTAHVQGTGTGTDTNTGKTFPLLFDADIRFMQGVYRGVDGRARHATFALIWLDTYQGQFDFANFTTQTHEISPGFAAQGEYFTNGVFWTAPLPDHSAQVEFGKGEAVLRVTDLPLRDFFTIPKDLMQGNFVPATASFEAVWSGPITQRLRIRDAANGFAGLFLANQATLAWSASEAGFNFVSDAANTSTTVFAQIGHERNGSFFPGGWNQSGWDKTPIATTTKAARGGPSRQARASPARHRPGVRYARPHERLKIMLHTAFNKESDASYQDG
jgi:hypothetical protein